MKSYLSGNPEIRLALNEDLSIGINSGSNFGTCQTSWLLLINDDCHMFSLPTSSYFDVNID